MINKYLSHYADPRAMDCLKLFTDKNIFDACVVIPAFNESLYIEPLLESLGNAAVHSRLIPLVIVVVNHKTTTDLLQKEQNRALYQRLNHQTWKRLHVFPIDLVSEEREFSPKEGVGDARKIGSDLALGLQNIGILRSDYFHTTDGDALVPTDYFELSPKPDIAAFVADYRHLPCDNPDLNRAHELYEYSLRYYESGLATARSPYAFPTIGSTLTISFAHYAMVRGFPRRLAAEDFYLLNKLAKVGRVVKRPCVVSLRARTSDRVPFGTGVGVEKILQQGWDSFSVYHPLIFEKLKTTLSSLENFSRHRSMNRVRDQISEPALIQTLEALGFFEMLKEADLSRKTQPDLLRHLSASFDAFITLKFVHYLRDHYLPNVRPSPPLKALKQAPFPELRDPK